MRDLGPDRLSEDGRYIVLRDSTTGELFRIPADRRLRALIDSATRARDLRSGQMELRMESSLSPRDIQTRIRRGDSTAQVAEAAGVPTEQIEGFAGPVLAEREFMCEQARKTPVRRKHVTGAGVLLGDLVGQRISEHGGTPDDAAWDAWRREDGRWSVVVTPRDGARAAFVFDVKSRYVLPADESAHDLVGDVALLESSDMAIADALQAQEASAPAAASAGEPEAVEVDAADEPTDQDDSRSARISSLKEARDRRAQENQQSLQDDDRSPEDGDESRAEAEAEVEQHEQDTQIAVPDGLAPRKKKAERRRVPSWDEIMFGGRDE